MPHPFHGFDHYRRDDLAFLTLASGRGGAGWSTWRNVHSTVRATHVRIYLYDLGAMRML